jgi:tetrathionate reductase subunit B
MNRRRFLRRLGSMLLALGLPVGLIKRAATAAIGDGNTGNKPFYGMGVDVDKCIGCGKCMEACKIENNVPPEPFYFRTWVERYVIDRKGDVSVQSIGTATNPATEAVAEKDILRSFFVPKLCNQCAHPACVQVCPVGATFQTEDGVVLVDETRCIGCRYCIQACPYGARYLHPETNTADKCTFCYHRISNGLLPACVEICPTQARVFGDVNSVASPLARLKRMNKIHVLKPHLNTEPKVYYANLDGEVK